MDTFIGGVVCDGCRGERGRVGKERLEREARGPCGGEGVFLSVEERFEALRC